MADPLHDSYRILQLEPGASLPTVKRAYRHLVKMWHPDHFAPGSKMELKAQEKLKEINLAYERLCKSRGQNASGDADASEQHKKSRKSASPSDEEPSAPKRSSSKKAEEEPAAAPAGKGASRKMGEVADDETADEASAPPGGKSEKPSPPSPGRRAFGFWSHSVLRRGILLSAAVLLAGFLVEIALPRGFWAARWGRLRSSAPAVPAGLSGTKSAPSAEALAKADPPVAATLPSVPPAAAPAPALGKTSADQAVAAKAPSIPPVAAPAALDGSVSTRNRTAPVGPAVAGAAVGQTGLASVGSEVSSAGRGVSSAFAKASADASDGAGAPSEALSSFTVGSSRAEVVEVQGMPDSFTEARFQYGSSEVFFQNGRVESWRDGNPRLKARKPADLSAVNLGTFAIGSRKDEVVAIQGKPDAITDTSFRYGSSVVFFLHDRVESWRDGNPRLKTRVLPAETVAKLATFTVGSRKDEVVEVQGLPDKFTDTTFQYGSSTVFFQNSRVVSWITGDPPLKTQKP